MQAAIASLALTWASGHLPIEDINLRCQVASLISFALQNDQLSKALVPFFQYVLWRRRQTKTHILFVCDPFTARAIVHYLQECSHTQASHLDSSPSVNQWDYDHVTEIEEEEQQTQFGSHTIAIKKLHILSREEKRDGSLTATRDAKTKPPSSALFQLSTNAHDATVLPNFVKHIQNQMPNALLIHRDGYCVSEHSSMSKHTDDEDGAYRGKRHKQSGTADDQSFGGIFFSTLERYYLRQNKIRAANICYKGSDLVLGAEPCSFEQAFVKETYKNQEVKISFVFQNDNDGFQANLNDTKRNRVQSFRFEAFHLNVDELKDYTQTTFERTIAMESASLLQKSIRIHEVEIHASKHATASWRSVSIKTTKTFKNTIVSETVDREFIRDVKLFLSRADFYAARGIPFKRGYVLHGPPGCGKTSLSKALAREEGLEIFSINLSRVTCDQFEHLISEMNFRTMGMPHILLFEDVDRCALLKKKRKKDRYESSSSEEDNAAADAAHDDKKPKNKPVTWAAFLNALDGVKEPYGRITILSANQSSKFTQAKNVGQKGPQTPIMALLRTGRIDKIIEVGYCTPLQMSKMFQTHFPDEKEQLDESKIALTRPISPADLGEMFMNLTAKEAREVLYKLPEEDKKDDKKESDNDEHGTKNGLHCKKRWTNRFCRAKPMAEKSSSSKEALKEITQAKANKKLRILRRQYKQVNEIFMDGEKAALDFQASMVPWLERITAEESVYTAILQKFKENAGNKHIIQTQDTVDELLETKPKRGRPKKPKELPPPTKEVKPLEEVKTLEEIKPLEEITLFDEPNANKDEVVTKESQSDKEEASADETKEDTNETKEHEGEPSSVQGALENKEIESAQEAVRLAMETVKRVKHDRAPQAFVKKAVQEFTQCQKNLAQLKKKQRVAKK